jgi:hypothetical protein
MTLESIGGSLTIMMLRIPWASTISRLASPPGSLVHVQLARTPHEVIEPVEVNADEIVDGSKRDAEQGQSNVLHGVP